MEYTLVEASKQLFLGSQPRELLKKSFAEDSLKIITSIEAEIISDEQSQMEAETMWLFDVLMRKENIYGRIEFDDNFKFNHLCKGSHFPRLKQRALRIDVVLPSARRSGSKAPLFLTRR